MLTGLIFVMCDLIKEFYVGRDIFVTGGNGLVGKALLEKLLRSCNLVNKVFILLRERRGRSVTERLSDLKDSKIFDRLKNENPEALEKLIIIPGDLKQKNLGMSEESMELMKDVSIIFHVAATVRFDEPLQSAIFLNLRGTHEALNFATKLKNFTMFVHVSTTYSYPYLSYVEEKIYPEKADWRNIIKMAENFDSETLDAFTHKLIADFPNTYTFTKHLAEQVVNDYRHKLPVTIMRPSIVHCAATEPYPGWFDSMIAVMGIIAAVGTGVVRTIYANGDVALDVVPLDETAKLCIVIPWWNCIHENKSNELPIHNISTSRIRTYSIRTMTHVNMDIFQNLAFNKCIWYPNYCCTTNIYYFKFRLYMYHVLPALLLDGLIKLSGREPFMMRVQRKAISSQKAVEFFVFKEYLFNTSRLHIMMEILKPDQDFRFDLNFKRTCHDLTYTSTLGCRRYMLKEDDSTMHSSVMRFKILKYADMILSNGVKAWFIYYILFKTSLLM